MIKNEKRAGIEICSLRPNHGDVRLLKSKGMCVGSWHLLLKWQISSASASTPLTENSWVDENHFPFNFVLVWN